MDQIKKVRLMAVNVLPETQMMGISLEKGGAKRVKTDRVYDWGRQASSSPA